MYTSFRNNAYMYATAPRQPASSPLIASALTGWLRRKVVAPWRRRRLRGGRSCSIRTHSPARSCGPSCTTMPQAHAAPAAGGRWGRRASSAAAGARPTSRPRSGPVSSPVAAGRRSRPTRRWQRLCTAVVTRCRPRRPAAGYSGRSARCPATHPPSCARRRHPLCLLPPGSERTGCGRSTRKPGKVSAGGSSVRPGSSGGNQPEHAS